MWRKLPSHKVKTQKAILTIKIGIKVPRCQKGIPKSGWYPGRGTVYKWTTSECTKVPKVEWSGGR